MNDILTTPRQAGDEDLVQYVYDVLNEQGHRNPRNWFNQQHPRKQAEITQGNPVLQRFLINDIFRINLGLLDVATHRARFVLTDQSSLQDWKLCFQKVVAPIIVAYEL